MNGQESNNDGESGGSSLYRPPPSRKKTLELEKLSKAYELSAAAGFLSDTTAVLREVLKDWEEIPSSLSHAASKAHMKSIIGKIQLSIDALDRIAPIVSTAAKRLAPLPTIGAVARIERTDAKREAQKQADIYNALNHQKQKGRPMNTNQEPVASKKSTETVALEKFISKTKPPPPQKREAINTRSSGQDKREKRTVVLPPPSNGAIYGPREIYKLLKPIEGRERSQLITELIDSKQILCQRRQLTEILSREDVSQVRWWWGEKGRSRIASVQELVAELQNTSQTTSDGNTTSWGADEVRNVLLQQKEKMYAEAGSEAGSAKISNRTVKTYHAQLNRESTLLAVSNEASLDTTDFGQTRASL